MNKDIRAWQDAWVSMEALSKRFINGIEIDLSKQSFEEILLLLKHSINKCISAQSLLIQHKQLEGLVPLSRKIFETYIQFKFLIKYPEALTHYALFERLKSAENHRHLLQANQELIRTGEGPIFAEGQEEEVRQQIAKEEPTIAYFASVGVTRRKVKNRKGKLVEAKSWFENFRAIPNLGALSEIVKERRMYLMFYPIWSASQHGQTVSIDYAIRVEGERLETKTNEEFENECWNHFTISLMAGALADLLLVLRFQPEKFEEIKSSLLSFTLPLRMTKIFEANFEKVRCYLD